LSRFFGEARITEWTNPGTKGMRETFLPAEARGSLGAFFVLFGIAAGAASMASGTMERRIVFAPGAVDARVEGPLSGIRDELQFVLKAKAGQHLVLDIDAAGPMRAQITNPDGDFDGPIDHLEEVLPADGDYLISITESPMGEAWKGVVRLYVKIQ